MPAQTTDTTSLNSAQASEYEDAESGAFTFACYMIMIVVNLSYFVLYFFSPFNLPCIVFNLISLFNMKFLQHITKQVPDSTSLNYNSLFQKRSMQLMRTILYLFQVLCFHRLLVNY